MKIWLKKYINRIILIISAMLLAIIFSSGKVEAATTGDVMNIYGQVTNESGHALPDVVVKFNSYTFTTDANGEYSIWVNYEEQGELTFEYGNYIIEGITANEKITYTSGKNIDAAYSSNDQNVTNELYKNKVSKKLNQIVRDSSKKYNAYYITGTDVISDAVKDINPGRISTKSIHISYVDQSMIDNMVNMLGQAGYKNYKKHGLFTIPANDNIKASLDEVKRKRSKTLCYISDVRQPIDNLVATKVLDAIYDDYSFNGISKNTPMPDQDLAIVTDANGNNTNQLTTITVREDRNISIKMKAGAAQVVPQILPSSTNIGGGQGDISGKVTDNNGDCVADVEVELYEIETNIPAVGSATTTESRKNTYTIVTDNNGYYEFLQVPTLPDDVSNPDGSSTSYKYEVRFTYGNANQLAKNSKYNGQDYTFSGAGNHFNFGTIENKENDEGYNVANELKRLGDNDHGDYSYIAGKTKMTAKYVIEDFAVSATGDQPTRNDVNLILSERTLNKPKISKEVSRIRLYLADGTKLIDWYKDANDVISGTGTNYVLDTTIGVSGSGQKLITLDDEITQGATLKLTYRITVEKGFYNNTYIINDYIDNVWGFSSEEKYDNGDPANDGWSVVDPNSIAIIDSMKDTDRTIVQAEFSDTAGGYSKEITLTKVLSKDDEGRYENWCEIASYSNSEGRRIYGTTPANCNPDTGDNTREDDTYKSEVTGVVPPFGDKSNKISIEFISSAIIVLGIGIVVLIEIRKKN